MSPERILGKRDELDQVMLWQARWVSRWRRCDRVRREAEPGEVDLVYLFGSLRMG
jgi:hypothetical protein